MKIGAIGIRTKIIVGDAATWYLVKKYIDGKLVGWIDDVPEELKKYVRVLGSWVDVTEDLASIENKVDKVEGSSLVPDTEIDKLAEYPEFEDLEFSHEKLTDKNSESAFQHVDTTVTKATLAEADKVALFDSATGKMVLTPKSNFNATVDNSIIEIPAAVVASAYNLTNNKQTLITGVLPNGVNSTLILPALVSGERNEVILHFKTNAVAAPTLVYSGFTPVWLNSSAISMKVNKQYTIVFEKINGIVKTSWGEY